MPSVLRDFVLALIAKQQDGKRYTIVQDYLGTPIQALDSKGEVVWDCILDIYGDVPELRGKRDFIPFRFQGQYEDSETGLYYNRFRYYSPHTGNYISQDPIGLAGGNPTLYGYVGNGNKLVDILGLAPTNPADRFFLKELLGNNAKNGGAYMFRTIDVRDDIEKWYVGKANNLYTRVRDKKIFRKVPIALISLRVPAVLPAYCKKTIGCKSRT